MRVASANFQFAKNQRGLTLIELLIAMLIGLFLLGGTFTVFKNTRIAFVKQNQLAQLQDSERMAMSVIADIIQSAGYFPDPHNNVAGVPGPTITGTYSATAPGDTISVSYETAPNDGILNCSGTSNTTIANQSYVNVFSVNAGQLICTMNSTPYTLVNGIQNLSILYGTKTNASTGNSVDSYLPANQMTTALWGSVISVIVQLTISNPLYSPTQSAQSPQKPTIVFQRVVNVMNQVGVVQ